MRWTKYVRLQLSCSLSISWICGIFGEIHLFYSPISELILIGVCLNVSSVILAVNPAVMPDGPHGHNITVIMPCGKGRRVGSGEWQVAVSRADRNWVVESRLSEADPAGCLHCQHVEKWPQ